METILTLAPELAADPAELAAFEQSYNAWLDSLEVAGEPDIFLVF
jgi:hypothetical protein